MDPEEIIGVAFWWSTFYGRWNVTPYSAGITPDHKREKTRLFKGKPILSDDQLAKAVEKSGKRLSKLTGFAKVLEPAYYAVWVSDPKHMSFMASRQENLVCTEV